MAAPVSLPFGTGGKLTSVDVWSAAVVDTRPEFEQERDALLALLAELPDERWASATSAGTWLVKDIALHLLDGDLTRLSAGRDGDSTGLLPNTGSDAEFAKLLAAKNERWLLATRYLSARVTRDLLTSSTAQLVIWTRAADLRAPKRVTWASDEPVPCWLDLARELTETWVHHQQIRHAVGLCTDSTRLPTVLRTFAWALPHHYRVHAPIGTQVEVDLDSGGVWSLTSSGAGQWSLESSSGSAGAASVRFTGEAAWRSFVGQHLPDNEVTTSGPRTLTEPVLQVRAIIT